MVPPPEDERARPEAPTEFLTRLARGLAHEIKNPLSTMAINMTLLEEEWSRGEVGPREKRSLKRLATLQREVARLEGILEDFLRFARGGSVNRHPGDLVSLVREVLEFMEPELQAHDIRVHAELPPHLPLVMIDEGIFRQALVNLIVNARQAMPGGGELIVQLRRVGSRAELGITDTGVGMEPEQLEHCFDLYWSTKREGTGLGLATVQRIVELHEGTIGVLSEPGRGTSFTLTLPVVQEVTGRGDAERAAAEEPEPRRATARTRPGGGAEPGAEPGAGPDEGVGA